MTARAVGDDPASGPNTPRCSGAGAPMRRQNALLRPVPDPGRANVISCAGYLPGDTGSCGWATDPRGAGLAVGSN